MKWVDFKTVYLTFELLDFDSFASRKIRFKKILVLNFTIGIGDFEFISTEVTVREKGIWRVGTANPTQWNQCFRISDQLYLPVLLCIVFQTDFLQKENVTLTGDHKIKHWSIWRLILGLRKNLLEFLLVCYFFKWLSCFIELALISFLYQFIDLFLWRLSSPICFIAIFILVFLVLA